MTQTLPRPRGRPAGKAGATLQHEAQLSVIRTGAMLVDDFDQMLAPYGLGGAQFNVLRILRGAGADGLCRNELRDRMLTRMPDMTRLLDRMERAGLVARTRKHEDRRMVTTRLTREGRQLIDSIDAEAAREQKRRFRSLSDAQLRTLVALLEEVQQQP
ncbi:MAG: MarR family winged helix-turn-helix transcriptional regulator [Gemmatimonadaceae bacterium]